MASKPTLKSVRGHICLRTHTNRAAHMQKSICLNTTGVSQEIKKPPWIKSFELNISEVQSSALTGGKKKKKKKPIIIFQREREGKNQRLKAAGLWYWGRKASRCEEDRLIKERSHRRRKRERAPQIGKGKSGSLCFAFHLHGWPYRPIGLGAEPVA